MNKKLSKPELEIRFETAADISSIHKLTQLAFRGRPYAGGDEQEVVDRLRGRSALTVSLVAFEENQLVGQITFSPAEVTDVSAPWFALGPVSVVPERQGNGIGASLIAAGIAEIVKLGALGCILTGNPTYYQRFGFEAAPDNAPTNEPADFFMLKLLGGSKPSGRFAFHPAFYA